MDACVLVIAEIEGVKHFIGVRNSSPRCVLPGGTSVNQGTALEAAFVGLEVQTGVTVSPEARRVARKAWVGERVVIYTLDIGGHGAPTINPELSIYLPLTPISVRSSLKIDQSLLVEAIMNDRGWTTCDDCGDELISCVVVDSPDYASLLTQAVNAIFELVFTIDHAHPSWLVRTDLALRAYDEVATILRQRVEARLTPEELAWSKRRMARYTREHGSREAIKRIDAALDKVPEFYGPDAKRPVRGTTNTFAVKGPSELN